MSDRLAELVRQRALVQEHLAWLNREIAAAAEAAKAAPAVPPAPASPPPPATPTAPAAADRGTEPRTDADADAILARYQVSPASVRQDVRKGCLLYFVGAMALLAALVTLLYFVLRRPT